MENFTKTIARIQQFIDKKGITINKFSTQVGVSNSYIYKMIRSEASVGSDILEKITNAYPELNAGWLITGKGPMIITEKSEVKQSTIVEEELTKYNANQECCLCKEKDKTIEAMRIANKALQIAIDALKTQQLNHYNNHNDPPFSQTG